MPNLTSVTYFKALGKKKLFFPFSRDTFQRSQGKKQNKISKALKNKTFNPFVRKKSI
jgi:hypothetical protein